MYKQTIKVFNRLNKIINLDLFYGITLYSDEIKLQGTANEIAISKLDGLFKFEYEDQKLRAKREVSGISIKIVLTF